MESNKIRIGYIFIYLLIYHLIKYEKRELMGQGHFLGCRRLDEPEELWPFSLFLLDLLRLSEFLDLWEPFEVPLDPEVSRMASLSAILWGVLLSDSLSEDDESL